MPIHLLPRQIRSLPISRKSYSILERCSDLSAPEISEKMDSMRWNMFGIKEYFTEIKRRFNDLMLSLSPHMEQQI